MSIWDRIRSIDRRVFYLLMAILVLWPRFMPILLPLRVDPMTKPLYEFIEEEIGPGDPVWISAEFSGMLKAELYPALVAITSHLFTRGARLFLSSDRPDGAMFAQDMWDLRPPGYEWGRNFVNFGFLAGGEAAVAGLIDSIERTAPADFLGNPTADMEIMQGINNIRDMELIIQLSDGGLGVLLWVRQVGDPYDIPVASAVSTAMIPASVPVFEAGQLLALLSGLAGAAEYEYLMRQPGQGTAGMGGQSLGHLFVIGVVLLGNLAHIMQRAAKRR